MKKKDIFQSIKDSINLDIENLMRTYDILTRQSIFAQCISVYDTCFYYSNQSECSEKDKIYYRDLIFYGYSIFIEKFYDEKFVDLSYVALVPVNKEKREICICILEMCRTIGWLDYIISNIKCGYLKTTRLLNYTWIRFNKKHPWNEHIENKYINYYSEVVAELQKEKYSELRQKEGHILSKMEDGAFVWLEHYMGYNNDMEIEKHFYEYSYLDYTQSTEWEMFLDDDLFGGIEYGHYIDTIIEFLAFSIKHTYFANILLQKKPELLIENLFFHVLEKQEFLSVICQNRSLAKDQAEKILECISINEKNQHLYKTKRLKCAPFIKVSKNQYFQSIAGLADFPYDFLLSNLREKCSKDWDKNAMNREGAFKSQLYQLFGDNFTCIKHNVEIVINKKVATDIDAVIIDKRNGEIALFQLKWQDPTSDSTNSLSSKSKNFNTTTKKWIETVRRWIDNSTNTTIAKALGIKEQYVNKDRIFLFVLGRRHGNYSGDNIIDKNCAWIQWYQLLKMIQNIGIEKLNISSLFDYAFKVNPFTKKIIETPNFYSIGKNKFIFGGNIKGLLSRKSTKFEF